jgi:hypothetical protein
MRWLKPVLLSAGLVVLDEQGIVALLIGIFLLFVYLPRSLGKRFQECRRERLIRFAIYLSAVLLVTRTEPAPTPNDLNSLCRPLSPAFPQRPSGP